MKAARLRRRGRLVSLVKPISGSNSANGSGYRDSLLLPLNQRAIVAGFRDLPLAVVDLPQGGGVADGDRDRNEAIAIQVLAKTLSRTRSQDDDMTATVQQDPELDALFLVALKPIDVSRMQAVLPVVEAQGLETLCGGRLPVQDMHEEYVMAVAAVIRPGAEDAAEELCQRMQAIYRPRRLIRWFHVDPGLKPDEPGWVLPMVDYPENVFDEVNPGVMDTPEYESLLARYRERKKNIEEEEQ